MKKEIIAYHIVYCGRDYSSKNGFGEETPVSDVCACLKKYADDVKNEIGICNETQTFDALDELEEYVNREFVNAGALDVFGWMLHAVLSSSAPELRHFIKKSEDEGEDLKFYINKTPIYLVADEDGDEQIERGEEDEIISAWQSALARDQLEKMGESEEGEIAEED